MFSAESVSFARSAEEKLPAVSVTEFTPAPSPMKAVSSTDAFVWDTSFVKLIETVSRVLSVAFVSVAKYSKTTFESFSSRPTYVSEVTCPSTIAIWAAVSSNKSISTDCPPLVPIVLAVMLISSAERPFERSVDCVTEPTPDPPPFATMVIALPAALAAAAPAKTSAPRETLRPAVSVTLVAFIAAPTVMSEVLPVAVSSRSPPLFSTSTEPVVIEDVEEIFTFLVPASPSITREPETTPSAPASVASPSSSISSALRVSAEDVAVITESP